jgi:hypothetical protein
MEYLLQVPSVRHNTSIQRDLELMLIFASIYSYKLLNVRVLQAYRAVDASRLCRYLHCTMEMQGDWRVMNRQMIWKEVAVAGCRLRKSTDNFSQFSRCPDGD